MPTYIIAILVLVAVLLKWGFTRVSVQHKPGFEGIEDPAAAQAYDRISRWPQFRMIRWMVSGRLAMYQPKGTLADIGCGPGYLVTLIARRFRHLKVVGFDTSLEMVRTAALNASALDLSDRVEFREGDVSNLPIPDGTLDFMVSTFSLHHWSDPSRGLVEFHRALKPGGQLLIFDLRRDARRFFFWLLRFAQTLVVPAALRRINEPLGSLLASYTCAEAEDIFTQSPFKDWRIDGGPAWLFAWAVKDSKDA